MRIKRGDHRPYAKIIGEITICNYENEGMQLDKMKVMNPTIIAGATIGKGNYLP
jgi:hypothetical protein